MRQLNRDDRRALPAKVPVGHLKEKVRKLIAAGGKRDRRLWEIATLAVLRERLRSGDVWVEGGQAFRPLDAQLMPRLSFEARKQAGDLRLGVARDADAWIAEQQQELDFKLKQLSYRARTGKLAGVRLVDGVLTIAKHRTKVPKAKVDAAKWLILDRLPQIDITDLLAEIDAWTGFARWFTHLRTGDTVRLAPALLAAILGDATNLGAKRMADASAGVSERQIIWARLFHIRPETYKSALAVVINAHLAHPHAKLWGQRHDLLLGRPVLPSRRPGRQAQRGQRSLQRRSREQILHLGFRPARPLPHPADGRHRGGSRLRAGRALRT